MNSAKAVLLSDKFFKINEYTSVICKSGKYALLSKNNESSKLEYEYWGFITEDIIVMGKSNELHIYKCGLLVDILDSTSHNVLSYLREYIEDGQLQKVKNQCEILERYNGDCRVYAIKIELCDNFYVICINYGIVGLNLVVRNDDKVIFDSDNGYTPFRSTKMIDYVILIKSFCIKELEKSNRLKRRYIDEALERFGKNTFIVIDKDGNLVNAFDSVDISDVFKLNISTDEKIIETTSRIIESKIKDNNIKNKC